MRVETYRRRRFAIWFLWILLAVALLFGLWWLLGNRELSCSEIEAIVEEMAPPGTVAEVDTEQPGSGGTGPDPDTGGTGFIPSYSGSGGGTGGDGPEPGGPTGGSTPLPPGGGGGPSVNIINTTPAINVQSYMDFGYVFPGEVVTKFFIITFDEAPYTTSYKITLADNFTGDYSMKEYILLEKDYEGGEPERDPLAQGNQVPPAGPGDYIARGDLSLTDTADMWWVTFYVPDVTGIYIADLEIEFPDPDVL